MSFSLRPHQLVAHWVPGFMLLLAVQLWHPTTYDRALASLPSDRAALTLVWIVSAFAVGQVLDSLRDLSECCWDRWSEAMDWDFFFKAERARVDQLDDFYFTYYVFNANLVLPLLAFCLVTAGSGHYLLGIAIVVAVGVVVCDARSLRKEIARRTKSPDESGSE
jgi:hypothetical protein